MNVTHMSKMANACRICIRTQRTSSLGDGDTDERIIMKYILEKYALERMNGRQWQAFIVMNFKGPKSREYSDQFNNCQLLKK
jgi:hypothetical protein